MLSMNKKSFSSFFPICMPFISFYYFIALARTSDMMLNQSSKSAYHCLVPDLRGRVFNFFTISMMFAVGLGFFCGVFWPLSG